MVFDLIPASYLLISAWMLLSHAGALFSREQTVPLLSVFCSFRVVAVRTVRILGSFSFSNPGCLVSFQTNSCGNFTIFRGFCHFSPTSNLLYVEIARQILVYFCIFSITVLLFNFSVMCVF